jgi:Ca-activated chloride channel family protein
MRIGILAGLLLALLLGVLMLGQVRIDVDQVLLHVSVTDMSSRYVTGLTQADFQLWEDKIEQEIQYFGTDDSPLSLGIIFDVSGSMGDKLEAARAAATQFISIGNRNDEYFLVEFNDKAKLVQDFTTDITRLQSRLILTRGKGSTALYDALYLGLEHVRGGQHTRKALLLITDGEDNHSRYSFSNVKDVAKERDVAIYSIGIMDRVNVDFFNGHGRRILAALADLTGGDAFFPDSVQSLGPICQLIALNLKNQYVLGYRSTNLANDGKWRKLRVQVRKQPGMPRMTARARNGYYASPTANAMK